MSNTTIINLSSSQVEAAISEYVAKKMHGYKADSIYISYENKQMLDGNLHACARADVTVSIDNSQYVSPCPDGFDTVLGYIAKHRPEVLDFMDMNPEATTRDGFWLTNQAKVRKLKVCKVLAPEVLRKQGRHIEMVNAYPVSLLAERLG